MPRPLRSGSRRSRPVPRRPTGSRRTSPGASPPGARPRDHAVLVRANGHADPVLRALNVAGIPWRFSGSSGLYARPEVRLLMAFLRAVADPESSVDLYALASSEVYGLGGEDLTAIVNTARRRHRSVWATLDELERQPGILRVSPASRQAVGRLVADLTRYTAMAHERPAGEVLYAFLRDSGMLARLARTETTAAEEGLGNVARFFDIIRAQSALLADDRAMFVAGHLQTLIEAGDDPATADLDPDADAVAVLTVHKAKGLEFPVVYLPGLVAGRFPGNGRGDALALPAGLGRGDAPAADGRPGRGTAAVLRGDDPRPRRADPVACRGLRRRPGAPGLAVRAGGARPACGRGAAGCRRDPAIGRGAARDLRGGRRSGRGRARPDRRAAQPELRPDRRVPDLSAQVQVRPRPARPDGAASRARVRRGDAQGGPALPPPACPGPRDVRGRARRGARVGLVERGVRQSRARGGAPGRRRGPRCGGSARSSCSPAPSSRPTSSASSASRSGGDRIRGRWDRVDVQPRRRRRRRPAPRPTPSADHVTPTLEILGREHVTITDYKSSDLRDPARARQRARESLQLQIYAMGYEAMTGRLPDQLALHFLDSGLVGKVDVDPKRLAKARERIATAAAGIRARDYHATPDAMACSWCPFRDICPSSAAPPPDRASARGDRATRDRHRARSGGAPTLVRRWRARSTMRLERVLRPWAWEGADTLDSLRNGIPRPAGQPRDLRCGRGRVAARGARRHDARPHRRSACRVHRGGAHRACRRPHHDPDRVAPRVRATPPDRLPGRLGPRGADGAAGSGSSSRSSSCSACRAPSSCRSRCSSWRSRPWRRRRSRRNAEALIARAALPSAGEHRSPTPSLPTEDPCPT